MARKPRRNKGIRQDSVFTGGGAHDGVAPGTSAAALPLLQESNVVPLDSLREINRRQNDAATISQTARDEIKRIIMGRYNQAKPQTDEIAAKMLAWERQSLGQWKDPERTKDEHIYFPKSRAAMQTIRAFLLQLITQLPELVTIRPAVQSVIALEDEWKRAKLMEALLNFYMEDMWKFKTDIMPQFLNTFLKFSMGIIKTTYYENNGAPDLRFDVVDRALQYFSPNVNDVKDSPWWIEKDFVTEAELEEDFFRPGHYVKPKDYPNKTPVSGIAGEDSELLRRIMGERNQDQSPIDRDELVERIQYWQSPIGGLEDRYIVMIGGVEGYIVRNGPNPYSFKGHPFRAKSYSPHEWQADGMGLMEEMAPLQEIINTIGNMRLDDVRKNLWSPIMVPEQLVTPQTKDDWDKRQKLLRVSDNVTDKIIEGGGKLQNLVAPLPVQPASQELFQDFAHLTAEFDKSSHVSDVVRGQAPAKVMTAFETSEMLMRNLGVFRPIFMQVMRLLEEVGEIAVVYFQDPEFFGERRILQIVGKRYDKTVEFTVQDGNSRIRTVTPDEMLTDVTLNAINGADAVLNRMARVNEFGELMSGIGAVPDLFNELRDRFDFGVIVQDRMRQTLGDLESVERSEAEIAQRVQARQKAEMQQLSMQTRMAGELTLATEEAKAQAKMQQDQAKIQAQAQADTATQAALTDSRIQEIIAQASAESQSQLKLQAEKSDAQIEQIMMKHESDIRLDREQHKNTMVEMFLEQRLEIEAQLKGARASVGKGQGEINTAKPGA